MFQKLLFALPDKLSIISYTFLINRFEKSLHLKRRKELNCSPDVHESVHRDTTMKITNKMQLYRLIYYSKSALHVSGDVFAYNQEQLTVFTVSGSVHPSCCQLAAGSNLGEHYKI